MQDVVDPDRLVYNPDEILKNADSSKAIPPLYGALLKNEQDVQLLERLAFMSRREAANK